jgi:salicylate hydroxylase
VATRDVPCTVYEQAPEHREVGAGVAPSANATRHLRRFGLGELLDAAAVEPSALVFRRSDDGGVIAAHTMGAHYRDAFGAPYYGVHRALQQILVATLGPGVVEPGNRCIGVVQDDPAAEVRVDFENGHTVTADLVVGADGLHSAVRRVVAAERPAVYSGTSGIAAWSRSRRSRPCRARRRCSSGRGRGRTCCTTRSSVPNRRWR